MPAEPVAPRAPSPDPDWIREAARAVAHDLSAFVRTLWALARHPRRFAVQWSNGELRALNPLAFLLNALAVIAPWRAVWARLLDPNPPTVPLWFELMKPMVPVVLNVTVTTLLHALVVALGGRRPLRSSWAMAMYVSGGPSAVFTLLISPLVLYGFIHPHALRWAMAAVCANLASLVIFLTYMVIVEAAVQRLSRWRVAIAVLLAWTSWGVMAGWLGDHHPEIVRSFLGA